MDSQVLKQCSVARKCCICGGLPAAYHFGAISCERCRFFFKRNLDKRLRCYFGWNCEVTNKTDRSKFTTCKACRFHKCLQNGMKPEATSKGRITAAFQELSSVSLTNFNVIPSAYTFSAQDVENIQTPKHLESFLSIQPPVMDCGSLVMSPRISNIRPGRQTYLPPSLRKYQTMLTECNHSLLDTARAVEHAAFCAYGIQIQTWGNFMERAITQGQVPTQPEQSVELTIAYLATFLSEQHTRTRNFAALLPGYSAFQALPNKHLLEERFAEVFMLHYSNYVHNDELYCLIGPANAHYGRYWTERLINKDYDRLLWLCNKCLNQMQLTMTERFVFLAALLFRPKMQSSSFPGFQVLRSLQLHYMAVLEYLIRSRFLDADSLLLQIDQLLCKMEIYQTLNLQYMPSVVSSETVEAAVFSAILAKDEDLIWPTIDSGS